MEKTEGVFTPEDRIGALEMQAMSVLDNRKLLLHMLDTSRQLQHQRTTELGELLEGSTDKSLPPRPSGS